MSYLIDALVFLVSLAVNLYVSLILLRFMLQLVRADFYNPLCQFIVKATNPPLKPLRRLLPGWRGYDIAALVLALVVQTLGLLLISLILSRIPGPLGLVVMAIAELIDHAVLIMIFAILIQVLLSWFNPGAYNPVTTVIHQLTAPILTPFRQMLPSAGGFDFSPLIVMVLLWLTRILLVAPIRDFGAHLA